jgi:hypothetical protein
MYILSTDGLKAFHSHRPGVFIKNQLDFNLHRSSLQILFRRSIASCVHDVFQRKLRCYLFASIYNLLYRNLSEFNVIDRFY